MISPPEQIAGGNGNVLDMTGPDDAAVAPIAQANSLAIFHASGLAGCNELVVRIPLPPSRSLAGNPVLKDDGLEATVVTRAKLIRYVPPRALRRNDAVVVESPHVSRTNVSPQGHVLWSTTGIKFAIDFSAETDAVAILAEIEDSPLEEYDAANDC